LLLFVGIPVVAVLANNEGLKSVLIIGCIYLVIPFGILVLIDFYRSNDGTTLSSRAFNVLFRVPLALLGLICLVVGVTIVGWVLYNVFIERQDEYTGFVVGLGSFSVGVALAIYGWDTLRSLIRRKEDKDPNV
jgi:predicted permease